MAVDLATAGVLWKSPELPERSGELFELSGDGSLLFATRRGNGDSRLLVSLDAATGRVRGEPKKGRRKFAVAPDGKSAATSRIENGQAQLDVIELPSGRLQFSLPTGKPEVDRFCYGPDQKSLLAVLIDGDGFNKNSFFAQSFSLSTRRPNGALLRVRMAFTLRPRAIVC